MAVKKLSHRTVTSSTLAFAQVPLFIVDQYLPKYLVFGDGTNTQSFNMAVTKTSKATNFTAIQSIQCQTTQVAYKIDVFLRQCYKKPQLFELPPQHHTQATSDLIHDILSAPESTVSKYMCGHSRRPAIYFDVILTQALFADDIIVFQIDSSSRPKFGVGSFEIVQLLCVGNLPVAYGIHPDKRGSENRHRELLGKIRAFKTQLKLSNAKECV
ncbi:hypothetical protein J6590_016189 [Homalodisca vitripennis]|nr:hypothetical protein J6590_016189 [Homalodisca vitripennis]